MMLKCAGAKDSRASVYWEIGASNFYQNNGTICSLALKGEVFF